MNFFHLEGVRCTGLEAVGSRCREVEAQLLMRQLEQAEYAQLVDEASSLHTQFSDEAERSGNYESCNTSLSAHDGRKWP